MKLALIGAGQRGMIYAEYAYFKKGAEITAVVEPHDERRQIAAEKFNVKPENVFANIEDFYAKGKICDAIILATMDKQHFDHTMAALDVGYDILLEKPVSPDPKECVLISEKAKKLGKKIIVCHVLRYTRFFSKLKEIIDSGELGRVVAIQHNENVGNFHIAHSFVRGNWRRKDETSPIIMQKSCHDMDILTWLVGSEAKKISSFGSLSHFKPECAPEGAAKRCLDCKVEDCQYHAVKAYMPVRGGWPAVLLGSDQSEEGIMKALETSQYGRCVYYCDNDVCDNQVTLIEFKNGVNVAFTLSGFTNRMCRTLKIMCEKGEIRADDLSETIEVTKFNSNSVDETNQRVIRVEKVDGFHGGGDSLLMEDFIANLEGNSADSKTAIERSIESHIMAYAAEEARITNTVVDIDEFKKKLMSE